MPGTWSSEPYSPAVRGDRPVMTATVPTAGARAWMALSAAGSTLALAGSATIGASVPSKSSAISARPGRASSAARPALPSGVAGSGTALPEALPSDAIASAPISGSPRAHWLSVSWSGPAGSAQPAAYGPPPAQPGNQRRIELRRRRPVDQLVQQLVVPRWRHLKHLEYLPLLGTWRSPPASLKGQDACLKLGQRRHSTTLAPSPPALIVCRCDGRPRGAQRRQAQILPGPSLAGRLSGPVRSQSVTSLRCLTCLTDFGLEDGFVAACHGVAMRIAPATPMIDITHLVPPGDVRRGAAVLAQTVPAMPPAVHVAVVDPGVGTARRAIAVQAPGGILVGPDNGLLSCAIGALGGAARALLL